jgi:putative transposase
MPRTARLDIPGLLQHVIVRGIEKREIFLDDPDREFFVNRLTALLKETEVRCYAWALIPNHAHLLLMPTRTTLASFMRRLLTGYAVHFNRQHNRTGHLFQNRYKSIVCEEETYLLELVRYIHLNPLRAGLVDDLAGLDTYPWSGHAALMKTGQPDGTEQKEILLRFGKNIEKARSCYRQFIADGVPAGRRNDLVGGGLKRSRVQSAEDEEWGNFDERILGSGEFVDSLQQSEHLRNRILT